MQDRPDKATLLDAVARFLVAEVKPAIADPAIGFRTLIAAQLASVVAREIRAEDEHDEAELARLRALLPEVGIDETKLARRDGRHEIFVRLNAELAARLRDGRVGEGELARVRAHLAQTLREKLSVVTPHFDTTAEVP